MARLPIAERKDIQIGLVSAVVGLLLILLILLLCSFEVADPPPKPPVVTATSEIDEILLADLKVDMGGGSEGSPSDDPVSEPQPQQEQVLTKTTNPKTSAPKGQSTKTTKPNAKGTPSSTAKSDNPFGGGGSGNEGDGDGKFGKDEGSGSGSGPGGLGDGKDRTRLNVPKVDDIRSDQNHTIHLRAQINSDGKIMEVTNISSKTTTTDQRILNQVIAAVKSQVRYSKKPGAGLELVSITIRLNAN
jgi:hypothetical protein